MTSSKSTKRALLFSALAILMCAAMLIGTTFAWFTDTASTGVNKIVSGKLDVVLEMNIGGEWVDANGKTLPFLVAGEIPAEGTEILWEPGCTYRVPELRIRNNGNLLLQAYVYVSGFKASGESDVDLRNVIDWKMSSFSGMLTHPDKDISVIVNPGQSLKFDLEAHMKEEAGNEYQGLSVEGISITVIAKQHTYEKDSIDDQYDKDATYPVMNAEGLKNALADGGFHVLSDNVEIVPEIADKTVSSLAPQMTVTQDTVLDLSDKKIGVNAEDDFGNASPVLVAVTGGTLTLNGEGTIDCEAGEQQVYGINVYGGKVVINGGSYYGAITAVQVQKGSLEINGGFFDMAPTCKAMVPNYSKYIVNCIDANYKNGTATISIKGGTFVNFDPSANPEGEGTSYVAEGYKVVSEAKENGDVWYTVVVK